MDDRMGTSFYKGSDMKKILLLIFLVGCAPIENQEPTQQVGMVLQIGDTASPITVREGDTPTDPYQHCDDVWFECIAENLEATHCLKGSTDHVSYWVEESCQN